MGFGETALRRWVDQLFAKRVRITPKAQALASDQQQIQALEKRIKRLVLEKKILEKATAFLDVGRDAAMTLASSLRKLAPLNLVCDLLDIERSSYYARCQSNRVIYKERVVLRAAVS